MKFTLSWLKEHLDTTASLDEISHRLTMLGLEVEEIKDPAAKLGGFVVAEILEADKHPDADRLKVCRVNNGREVLQVVCGAPNARAGLKVILAQPGVVIPVTGDALKKGNVRGVESQGMMCSWRELALGEDHDGIAELDASLVPGTKLTDAVSFDPLIEIAITPNRGDCLGVRGIARDLAASGMGSLKPLPVDPVKGGFESPIKVSIDPASSCSVFAGRYFRGVKNGESPAWLKQRLEAVGLRPISLLVDITNYFTIALDRPLHVFDADKLTGDIIVRPAKDSETLAALNGKTYELPEGITVVADQAGAQGVGGIIGGEPTGCQPETVNVYLECALFDASRTAAAGRALAIDSDARHRFERAGVDPAFVIDGMELASRMILDLCGGEASAPVIAGAVPDTRQPIRFRPSGVAGLGGVEVPVPEQKRILEAIGCAVTTDGETFTVTASTWRSDIAAEHDLVEEVLRVHGYDNLPAVPMPRVAIQKPLLSPAQRRAAWVRRGLAGRGMVEAVTFSFLPSAHSVLFGGAKIELQLANPISADLDAMRPSILPNLIAAAGRNADRGFKDLALFELGPVFAGDAPEQQLPVTAGLRAGKTGARHWSETPRAVDPFDAKADAIAAIAAAGGPTETLQVTADAPTWYHPGRSGTLRLGPKVIAWFGELHPRVLSAMDVKGPMVAFELFLDAVPMPKSRATKAKTLLKPSHFQPLERDFAFILDATVAAEQVVRAARGADKGLITDVAVFDVYEGPHLPEGKKSLAISVTLQPTEKTLTDAEIEAVAGKVVAAVTKATGGTLRA